MTRKEQIEKLSQFFYLLLLDEEKTAAATLKAIRIVTTKLRSSQDSIPSILVAAAMMVVKDIGNRSSMKLELGSKQSSKSVFIMPKDVSLSGWRAFLAAFQGPKRSPTPDLQGLIWRHMVGFEIEDISSGLGESKGTVLLRLSHGLKNLARTLAPRNEAASALGKSN